MFKKHLTILIVLFVIGVVSLAYGSQVLADLSIFDPAADVFETKLILVPEAVIPANQEIELISARPVIARRLDTLGIDGPYNLAVNNDRLEVTLPKDENIPYIAAVITSVGEIVFIDGGEISPSIDEQINLGSPSEPDNDSYNRFVLGVGDGHTHRILFTNREIIEFTRPDSADGQIFYQLKLEAAAAERLASFIKTHPGSPICMVIDEQILNCSTMYHQNDLTFEILPKISNSATTGMTDLILFLYSGPLSSRLKVITDY